MSIPSTLINQTAQVMYLQSHTGNGLLQLDPYGRIDTLVLTDVTVISLDTCTNKPWSHQLATASTGGAEINPTTFAQTQNWTNSPVASNATLSNTAASYTTLGGLFSFVAVAGAATDFPLFGFTVPSPYSFICTGINIDTYNTGAAVATTAHLFHWAVANNSSAVSLATAGLNRTHVGTQTLASGAAIGQAATPISVNFDGAPLRTEGGRIFHVILRMPVATATASQVIQGGVNIRGYFE